MDQDVTDKKKMESRHAWKIKLYGRKTGKFGEVWVGLTKVGKIMVLDWGQSKIAVNNSLQDLEGRVRLKRMWNLIPQLGRSWNELEVSSDPGFQYFFFLPEEG